MGWSGVEWDGLGWVGLAGQGRSYRVPEIIFGKCLVNVSINGLESAASAGHVNQARAEEAPGTHWHIASPLVDLPRTSVIQSVTQSVSQSSSPDVDSDYTAMIFLHFFSFSHTLVRHSFAFVVGTLTRFA